MLYLPARWMCFAGLMGHLPPCLTRECYLREKTMRARSTPSFISKKRKNPCAELQLTLAEARNEVVQASSGSSVANDTIRACTLPANMADTNGADGTAMSCLILTHRFLPWSFYGEPSLAASIRNTRSTLRTFESLRPRSPSYKNSIAVRSTNGCMQRRLRLKRKNACSLHW